VGLVGCGAVAKLFYAPLLPLLPGVTVAGVCDLSTESAQALAGGFHCPALALEELIQTATLLIVATPPSSHHALARKALEAGVDVVLEKPFVVSAAQAEDLVALAASLGRGLFVAHFRRFFRKVQLARQVIGSGVLGAVTGLELFEGGRFGWDTASGYVSRDPYGGVLLDTGSHTLDQTLYTAALDETPFTVRVEKVERDKAEPAHNVNARFTLDTSRQQIMGRIVVSRRQMLANLVRIRCEHGEVEFGVRPGGSISVTGNTGRFDFQPPGETDTQVEAFARQYLSILQSPQESPLQAARFLGQMRILEAILHHA
jgi:predicted dehydrogenase